MPNHQKPASAMSSFGSRRSTRRHQPRLISQLCVIGKSTFRPINSLWSDDQGVTPCIAFIVTWDGVPAPDSPYPAYACRVRLSRKQRPGDLALVTLEGGDLTLVDIADEDYWFDAITRTPVSALGASIVGRVVEERGYNPANAGNPAALIEMGLNATAGEDESGEGTGQLSPWVLYAASIGESNWWEFFKREFRGCDAGKPPSTAREFAATVDDLPLRHLCARMFRAGQLVESYAQLDCGSTA